METMPEQLNAHLDSVSRHPFRRLDGSEAEELLFYFHTDEQAPAPIYLHRDGCFLRISGDRGCLRAPLVTGELKHFFEDFRNYDYLPAEDRAVHRSVAQFADRSHRERATRDTCYVRYQGLFIPVPPPKRRHRDRPLYEPPVPPKELTLFQEERTSRLHYLAYREDKEKDMVLYLNHVLKVLMSFYFAGFS